MSGEGEEGTDCSVKVLWRSQTMMGRFFLSWYVGNMTLYLLLSPMLSVVDSGGMRWGHEAAEAAA